MSEHETDVRRLARILSEISHSLESSDDRQRRVERVLELARDLVPSRRCALLEVHDEVSSLYVSPPGGHDDRRSLLEKLTVLYRLVAGRDEIEGASDGGSSLALPVMALDHVVGVIRVEPDREAYDVGHLRLLSIVAAQLGAYLAMVRLRERDAARTREIEAAHDFQRLLAGVVGHDLRNPLAVITMAISSMLGTTTDVPQARKLERALRNAEQATRLITDLVDVTESRVTGTIGVALQDADFHEVIERTVDDLRQAYGTRTIELVTVPGRSARGRFDPIRVSQIVTNLVINAVVHGDPTRPVRVKLAEERDEIVITVHNWGAPIAASLLPTIFDPFKQGAAAARPPSARGLGLGLYIVDCLTRGHGGTVGVASDAETGTVFRVRLPRRAAPTASRARGIPTLEITS